MGNESEGKNRIQPETRNNITPTTEAVSRAIEDLFSTHEVRVLGAMGLIIGYISIFFTKIMEVDSFYVGIFGVAMTTMLLLLLDPKLSIDSKVWWARSIVVVIMSLFLTSPQFYYAWTVSVKERRDAKQADLLREIERNRAPQQSSSATK
jgi:hypothetical protein